MEKGPSSVLKTPFLARVVWVENLSQEQIHVLEKDVENSLKDPDFSIVTNFPVHYMSIRKGDLVWAEGVDMEQIKQLKVDLKKCWEMKKDFILVNYPVHIRAPGIHY